LVDFKRSETAAFPKGVVSPISLKIIKEAIIENLDDDGYLAYDKIPVVNDILVKSFTDEYEFTDEDETANESFDDVKVVKAKTKEKRTVKSIKAKSVKKTIRSHKITMPETA
jgi:hypothetical protein